MTTLTLQITSPFDRENIVAEIWFGNNQVAEISNENNDGINIEIFTNPDCGVWFFNFDEFNNLLTQAKLDLHKK
jgi:hypothetical protein